MGELPFLCFRFPFSPFPLCLNYPSLVQLPLLPSLPHLHLDTTSLLYYSLPPSLPHDHIPASLPHP